MLSGFVRFWYAFLCDVCLIFGFVCRLSCFLGTYTSEGCFTAQHAVSEPLGERTRLAGLVRAGAFSGGPSGLLCLLACLLGNPLLGGSPDNYY